MRTFFVAGIAASSLLAFDSPAVAAETDWTERLDFSGDTRLRYEGIDEDGQESRNRMRFRARLGLSADVYDDVKVVLRFATGGDNPVSTNQTFDDGFSTKDIGVDRAYVQWTATDQLTLLAGKMKNPLYRAGGTQLIWDNDLNPEGIAALFESGNVFLTGGLFAVEERSSADDSMLYAAQAGMDFDLDNGAQLTAGFGYLAYSDTVGNSPFFNGNPRGNSVDINGNYLFDYRNFELFAQYAMSINDLPLTLFAHLTENREVGEEDTAYAFGAKLGSAREQGQSEFFWTYQDVEADAVIGTFNDSNFGAGNTDGSGHILRGKYLLRDRISVGGSLFLNDIDRFQGIERDYGRIQIDLEFKFD